MLSWRSQLIFLNSIFYPSCVKYRHASIDPKVRKERNLPEHLIRLCVGIEDPDDLLDDLESALLQAGAIRIVDDPEAPGQQKLERVLPEEEEAEAQAAAAEAGEIAHSGTGIASVHKEIPDFITSAPGKVILFGEHAVVHGVVSDVLPLQTAYRRIADWLPFSLSDIDCHRRCSGLAMLLLRFQPK